MPGMGGGGLRGAVYGDKTGICLYQLLFHGTASADRLLLDLGYGGRISGIRFCKRRYP